MAIDVPHRSYYESAVKERSWRIVDDSAMGQIAFEWARFICRALGRGGECGVGGEELRREVGWDVVRPWQTEEVMADIFLEKQRKWKERM